MKTMVRFNNHKMCKWNKVCLGDVVALCRVTSDEKVPSYSLVSQGFACQGEIVFKLSALTGDGMSCMRLACLRAVTSSRECTPRHACDTSPHYAGEFLCVFALFGFYPLLVVVEEELVA